MQITEQISNQSYEVTRNDTREMEQKKSTVAVLFTNYAYFVIYSFIGWVWETVITTIDTGVLQKRGFLDVPILPIYGVAITFIVFLFYKSSFAEGAKCVLFYIVKVDLVFAVVGEIEIE